MGSHGVDHGQHRGRFPNTNPVGSPEASRVGKLNPGCGSGESRSIPATSNVVLFTHRLCASMAKKNAGRSGMMASSSARCGPS